MVHIHRSNRLDTLVTQLGDIVAEPLSDPYARETIVVSSLGMERWLVCELSRRFGVWTNAEHPLPRAFVERILASLAPEPNLFDVWDREHLGLSVARLLADDAIVRRWPTLHNYLEGSTRLERCLELSHPIADAFDQYLVYRPDWIENWKQGRSIEAAIEPWQSELFGELVRQLGPGHFAQRLQLALQRLDQSEPALAGLPERICCFQVGLLPPSYWQLLQSLSRRIPTHLFLLSPSRAYVEWLRTGPQPGASTRTVVSRPTEPWQQQPLFSLAPHVSKGPETIRPSGAPPAHEPWEQQPLFSSLYRQSRQLETILSTLDGLKLGKESFEAAEPKTLLELLQNDIGALCHRHAGGPLAPYELSPDDRSLSIHACHSRRREIECLRENLLDQFDRDPSLSPEDVLVMLADIEEYAPLVDAIFGAKHASLGHIPYTIADRSCVSFNGLADALLRLLELFSQRLTFNRLLELLSLERLRLKFEISAEQVPRIEAWLTQLRFTWGIDGADRKSNGASETEEHTLRFGLSRLLLGVALDSSQAPLYAGRAPLDLEGDEAELAGRLIELCETCFEYRTRLTKDQSIASYTTVITNLLDDVFTTDWDSRWQRTEICDTLTQFSQVATEAGFNLEIPFGSLRSELQARLDTIPSARAFLSGGVTFCKMLPLRSIPFRVIAMVGLDDDQFPRRERHSSFNAINRQPRVGDRRVSDEDRFLFGETLLACRERLLITYLGRSSRDDSALPPSVVVEELLNTVEESCRAGSVSTRAQVLHSEALQPFSPRYFDNTQPNLISRSESHYRAAVALISPRKSALTPDYSASAGPEVERVQLRELVSLLRDPSQLYSKYSLHAARELEFEPRDGTEPIVLSGLPKWCVTQELLESRQRSLPLPLIKEQLRAAGELPVLALGDLGFDLLNAEAESLLSAASPFSQGKALEDVWVSLPIDGVRVEGWVDSIWPEAHLHVSPSRVSPKKLVQAWVEHLCLNASDICIPTALVLRSIDKKSTVTHVFQPLLASEARQHLTELVKGYRLALSVPLPFWLDPAETYRKARSAQKEHAYALMLAAEQLEQLAAQGNLSPHFESLYGEAPTDDDWPTRANVPELPCFAAWSIQWLSPLYAALREPQNDDSAVAGLEVRA